MIVNFLERAANFGMAFEESLDHFKGKGIAQTWDWSEMLGQEHDNAFTVAKMMNDDLLLVVKNALEDTLANGKTLKDFQKELIPILQKKGWWGKKTLNPGTALEKTVQLGSASRLETIYRTNLQSSYAAGHWESIQANKIAMPYLMYDAVDDGRTREDHAANDNVVRPVDDKFWLYFMPPNGWSCRCGVIQLSSEDLADYGLNISPPQRLNFKTFKGYDGKTHKVPEGIDFGFDHNPGKARAESLQKVQANKLTKFEGALKDLVEDGNRAAKLAAEKAAAAAAEALKLAAEKLAIQQAIDAEKAIQSVAQLEIDDALTNKTPYLAPAIKDIQKTIAGQKLTAVEVLALAQEKSAKKLFSDQLAKYKKAAIAGKQPNPNAQKAFDSLPDEAQGAILVEIDVKSGNALAKEELTKIAAGEADKQATIKKQIYNQIKKTGTEFPDAKSFLFQVEKLANEKQAAKEKSKHVNGYKKKAIAGQIPTPKQKEIFDGLTGEEQTEIKVAITKAQDENLAATLTAAQAEQELKDALDGIKQDEVIIDAPLSMENMVWYKNKSAGGNPGAFYKDSTTGKSYYIKTLKSEDIARNEVLASRLYEAAGVEAPKYIYMPDKGQHFVASEVIEGISESQSKLTGNLVDNIHENFAVDAWLSNWDVVGLNYDNLVIVNNRAVRMDPGGALRYRAMGTLKNPNQFTHEVTELKTLKDKGENFQAGSVFENGTHEQLIIGIKKVLRVTDEQIDALVDKHGPRNLNDAAELKKTMKGRREYLAKLYPEALEIKTAPVVKKPKGATAADVKAIEEARVNGHSLSIDDDLIEDHNVKFHTYQEANGKTVTVATFKVTDKGLDAIESGGTGKLGPDIHLSTLKASVKEAAIGIGALVRDGHAFRFKDIQRVEAVTKEFVTVIGNMKKRGDYSPETMKTLEAWQAEFLRMKSLMVQDQPAQAWSFMMNANSLPDTVFSKLKEGEIKGISYQQKDVHRYASKSTNKSNLVKIKGGAIGTRSPKHLSAEPEKDVKITVFNGTSLYNRGYTEIEVKGSGLAAIDKALKQIGDMGIPSSRTTKAARTELFLDQTAYRRWHVLNQAKYDDFKALDNISDLEERQLAKLKFINDDVGYDISKKAGWLNKEAKQAFEQGRNLLIRADLDTPAFDKWADNHVLFHAIGTLGKAGYNGSGNMVESLKQILEGGGTLASLLERQRRGIPESNQAAGSDYERGGAGFVFTRIKSRKSPVFGGLNATGLYFKPHKHMKRMDRVSYNSDNYGSQTKDALANRAETPEGWASNAKQSTDETIFKEGLSLFDDLEKIVVYSVSDRQELIKWLRMHGYEKWPDGRELEEVIFSKQ